MPEALPIRELRLADRSPSQIAVRFGAVAPFQPQRKAAFEVEVLAHQREGTCFVVVA